MYDYSGQFAFEVGMPAKSAISGIVFTVVPGVCGLATFSPRLDEFGNSVRGIAFCQQLSKRLSFHLFGRLPGLPEDAGRPSKSRIVNIIETKIVNKIVNYRLYKVVNRIVSKQG